MAQEGNEGVSQAGFALPEVGTMSPRNNKRGRDQHEEGTQLTTLGRVAQCEILRDLNLSSDVVSSHGGGYGTEGQNSPFNNLAISQSEKRIKCGPSNLECNRQNPSPKSLTANVGVVITDGGNNVSAGIASQNLSQDFLAAIANEVAEARKSGIARATQFQCDICSVKSTSAKDLETHLAGKRHAKAKKLASGLGTSSAKKIPSDSEVSTPQKIQTLIENGSTHFNTNLDTATSIGQRGSLEASKGYMPGCTGATDMEEGNGQAILSKCSDSKDTDAVAGEQLTSTGCPLRGVQVLCIEPSCEVADNRGHNRYRCQPGVNGTSYDSILADGLMEKIYSRMTSDREPYKHLVASLRSRSNSDCVYRALASVSSTCGCPGLEDLSKNSCVQGAESSDSQLEGTKEGDSNGIVTMHTLCFSNLLHEVRASIMEDLVRYVGVKGNPWVPNAASVSAQGEDLHCTVCRVEYGSKADLDLHLAGKKHASLVQRMSSRCQLCNIDCNSERDFKAHLSGKKHASKLRLVQKRVTF